MKKYYKFLIIIILFFTAVFLFFSSYKPVLAPENIGDFRTEEVKIDGQVIKVEIADTKEKREKGLSGRQSLAENSGMLFIFPEADYYSFWMEDMNFGLDFIWIRGNEIVEITRNVRSEYYEPPNILIPKNKTDKVLEVNAGLADRLGLQEGDRIEFN